jgi:hypothetical protein
MLQTKTNKRNLIIGALIILLCISCLTGATLALFTSTLQDGTIGIVTVSGSVKVDIVDVDQKSLVNEKLSFMTTKKQEEIYFEPGACFYTQPFQVKNMGDVTINFTLYVSNDEQIDMNAFLEAFDIRITTDPFDPSKSEEMKPFEGTLAPGKCSDPYYLVIKMKETAGNDFHGAEYDGIGVTVFAVQGNVKS